MKKKILSIFIVSVFVALIGGFLPGATAFAAGGAIVGTDPTGGTCGGNGSSPTWWDTCFGYSWQAYTVKQDLSLADGGKGIHFYTTSNTGEVVYINFCKAGDTLYNYGFEAYKPAYNGIGLSLNRGSYQIIYNADGRQVSTQRNKNGVKAPYYTKNDLSSAKGAYTLNSDSEKEILNYLEPSGYVEQGSTTDFDSDEDVDTVAYKFAQFFRYAKGDGGDWGINLNQDVRSAWEEVGAFCWNEDMTIPPPEPEEAKFLASSKVEVNKVRGDTTVKTAGTGISYQNKDTSTVLSIKEGESVKIVFTNKLPICIIDIALL